MSYEPRGKVKALIEAMGSDPRRVWTSDEVAKVLGVASFRSTLLAHTDSASRNGALFRRMPASGELQFRLIPFDATAANTTATGWVPPQMACTRPSAGAIAAQQVVQERVEPAGEAGDAGAAPTDADLPACTESQTDQKCLTAAPPAAAPARPDASIPQGEQDEPADPVTWNVWEDGDLDLFGLIELENGGHRLPAEALRRLRKFIAWMPA